MREPVEPARPRLLSLEDRDRTADDRDRTAQAHDQTARSRDERSEARDERADRRDRQAGHIDAEAAADRAGARRDRRVSAGDRQHAEDDRDAASADRVRAALDRASLVMDGLTGAHQRAPGLVELGREMSRARRMGQTFVLAFLDVDGLKSVNDTQGHAAGDDLLRQVVRVVRNAVREYDLVIRYGGDEFLCGLPDVELDDAKERFTRTQSEWDVPFSIGFSVLGSEDTIEDLIARADAQMYEVRARTAVEASASREA